MISLVCCNKIYIVLKCDLHNIAGGCPCGFSFLLYYIYFLFLDIFYSLLVLYFRRIFQSVVRPNISPNI